MTILSSLSHLSGRAERQCVASAWFGDHFGAALPRGLREQAEDMSWESFVATYGHTAGPLRLGHWACTDTERSAARLGPQARNFQAVIAVGDRISTSTAAASGPVAALTAMLHERGITRGDVEIPPDAIRRIHRHLRLRQRRDPGRMGDGLGGRSDAVRAARGHRVRQPAGRLITPSRRKSPHFAGKWGLLRLLAVKGEV